MLIKSFSFLYPQDVLCSESRGRFSSNFPLDTLHFNGYEMSSNKHLKSYKTILIPVKVQYDFMFWRVLKWEKLYQLNLNRLDNQSCKVIFDRLTGILQSLLYESIGIEKKNWNFLQSFHFYFHIAKVKNFGSLRQTLINPTGINHDSS